MEKAEGAFLTIGELAQDLGVGQHVLRYWETRFPQLRPLQRSGNRRYYRPQDVAVARTIHRLLTVEGFTMKGALKALSERPADAPPDGGFPVPDDRPVDGAPGGSNDADALVGRLRAIRADLADALSAGGI